QAQASLTEARAELAGVNEETAELEARRSQVTAEVEAARARLDLLLASAATLLGVPVEQMTAPEGDLASLWRTVSTIEIAAQSPGIVDEVLVTSGAWVDERAPVLKT